MKLLSRDSRRDPQRHQFHAGMRNVAYLAGYIREPTPTSFKLQLTNNENLLLPILLPPGVRLPERFSPRMPIKCVCQVRGGTHPTTGARMPIVYARSFERPNILELPIKSAFEKRVPPEAPNDETFKPFGSGFRPTDSCNQVILAGYVAGIDLRRPSVGEDGTTGNGKCVLLVRQTKNEAEAIPVTMYGKWVDQVHEQLRPGMPVYVEGKYRVRPVPTGEPAGEDGKVPVTAEPYLHVDPPQMPGEDDIVYLRDGVPRPDWLDQMIETLQRQRRRPVAPGNGAATPLAATPVAVPRPVAGGNGAHPARVVDPTSITF